MFISPAYAQAAASPGGGDMIASLLPLILIFVVFYFLMIRPQQKKAKAHREMLSNLRRGDRVVTGGGIHGRVVRVENDNDLVVEIAPDVRVRVRRGTIADLMSKPEPAAKDNAKDNGSDGNEGETKGGGRKKRVGRKSAGDAEKAE